MASEIWLVPTKFAYCWLTNGMILFFYAEFIANGAKINFRPILGSNREQLPDQQFPATPETQQ